MKQHKYYIVEPDGIFILLTIVSQNTNRSFDDEAKVSITPLLPVIAAQYGLDKVFYSETY